MHKVILYQFSKNCIVLGLIVLWHSVSIAQNLLGDGGFEKLTSNRCLDPDDSFSRLEEWYSLDATPDLFVANCTYNESDFIFWNEDSAPYEGNNFVGIWSRWNSNNTYFSEGISTQFTEPLVAGETYLFQIMIRNMGGFQGLDASVSGCSLEPEKHIDLYISDDSIKIENNFSNGTSSTTASLVASLASPIITGGEMDDWSLVTTCFTAQGGERFLALMMPLGTFGTLPPCAIQASSGVFRSFYYQLDEASVSILPEVFSGNVEKCIDEEKEVDVSIFFEYDFDDTTLFVWEDGFSGMNRTLTDNGNYEIEALISCTSIFLELEVDEVSCSEEVYIPNAFSPNNDGINDRLVISYANKDVLANFNLMIYDRWGGIMFDTQNPTNSWDGSFSGKDASSGTYILQLSYDIIKEDIVQNYKVNQSIFLSR